MRGGVRKINQREVNGFLEGEGTRRTVHGGKI